MKIFSLNRKYPWNVVVCCAIQAYIEKSYHFYLQRSYDRMINYKKIPYRKVIQAIKKETYESGMSYRIDGKFAYSELTAVSVQFIQFPSLLIY